RRLYLHNTALGKALIANGDYPYPTDLPAITTKTITDTEQLIPHLQHVMQVGYALDDEENETGVRCIACPIFDEVGIVIATLGVSGPTIRITYDDVAQVAAWVHQAACDLSHQLGYEG